MAKGACEVSHIMSGLLAKTRSGVGLRFGVRRLAALHDIRIDLGVTKYINVLSPKYTIHLLPAKWVPNPSKSDGIWKPEAFGEQSPLLGTLIRNLMTSKGLTNDHTRSLCLINAHRGHISCFF